MKDDWLNQQEYDELMGKLMRIKAEVADERKLDELDKHYEEVLAEIVRNHEYPS